MQLHELYLDDPVLLLLCHKLSILIPVATTPVWVIIVTLVMLHLVVPVALVVTPATTPGSPVSPPIHVSLVPVTWAIPWVLVVMTSWAAMVFPHLRWVTSITVHPISLVSAWVTWWRHTVLTAMSKQLYNMLLAYTLSIKYIFQFK